MMNKERVFQIVYSKDRNNTSQIAPYFQEEAIAMEKEGFLIGIEPIEEATDLIYRGFAITEEEDYPKNQRYIHSWRENALYHFIDLYYPIIEDLTIESFFVDSLDDEALMKAIAEKGWNKAFIKNRSYALEHIEEGLSIFPKHSTEEMMKYFRQEDKPYAIRRYVEPKLLEDDTRYWVLNGKVYRRDNLPIPKVVYEAAKRLNKYGGKYYTIDATNDFVIEVNPGESSDRHGENSVEVFASWFRNAFLE